MTRCGLALTLIIGLTMSAQAHYFFVLPAEQPQAPLRLILSDGPQVDAAAQVDPGSAKFQAVGPAGQATPLQLQPGGEGWLALPVSADVKEVFGIIEYGVVLRGEPEPVLIVHHSRAVLASLKPGESAPGPHNDQPLEVSPVVRSGRAAFRVTASGKPLGAAGVVVYAPEEKRPRAVKTDADGVTPAFERAGTYAARSWWTEDRAGEFQGRPYKQVRHYATLVVRYDAER